MRSVGHLYIPCTKPVQWCDELTEQTRVSKRSWRLADVVWEVVQAHHVAGVSAMEGRWYKGENRGVYVGTEWAGSSLVYSMQSTDLIFSSQNRTPQHLVCSIPTNIPMVLAILFILKLIFFSKTLVQTMATLLNNFHQREGVKEPEYFHKRGI